MDISIIGTGYVGLVTAAVFADLGNNVVCLDNDQAKIRGLKNGIMPIYEPGLAEMVKKNYEAGRMVFTTDYKTAVERSEIIFIAVGTPPGGDGETDLSQVSDAAEKIAEFFNGYKIIVNKSTVPVGTGDLVKNIIMKKTKNKYCFDICSNPEFLREGDAIHDTLYPDRIVIGAEKRDVAMKLLELYSSLERPMIITDVRSAEVIKYASNAFLATKISFINEIANLCEKCGADINDIKRGMGMDSRIGSQFLNAGLGYGGSCFPKDSLSLINTAEKYGIDFKLLKDVVNINNSRSHHFVSLIRERYKELKGKVIAVFGLSFKPNTDDMREAKSIEIIKLLKKDGVIIKAFDPIAAEKAKAIMPDIIYCDDPYEAARDADAILLVTEWRVFKFLDMKRIRTLMKTPVIFDGRNLYKKKQKEEMGFEFYALGVSNNNAK